MGKIIPFKTVARNVVKNATPRRNEVKDELVETHKALDRLEKTLSNRFHSLHERFDEMERIIDT